MRLVKLFDAIARAGPFGHHGRMQDGAPTRRRGIALEEAILDAAWAELASVGYAAFTFEAAARRAGTGKSVLYRRWPSRARLASAAIARELRQNPLSVPDLGNARDELCLLLRMFADRSPPRLLRLVFEMSEDMAAEQASFLDPGFQTNPLAAIVARAIARGEIDERRLSPRVLRMPLSLVVQEIIITIRPITDAAIAEIVDEIFLPLVSFR